jgi:site-specific recombinase XerC
VRTNGRDDSHTALRDELIIVMAFNHGFRSIELSELEGSQVRLDEGLVEVERHKNGMPSMHHLGGAELRMLRRWNVFRVNVRNAVAERLSVRRATSLPRCPALRYRRAPSGISSPRLAKRPA